MPRAVRTDTIAAEMKDTDVTSLERVGQVFRAFRSDGVRAQIERGQRLDAHGE